MERSALWEANAVNLRHRAPAANATDTGALCDFSAQVSARKTRWYLRVSQCSKCHGVCTRRALEGQWRGSAIALSLNVMKAVWLHSGDSSASKSQGLNMSSCRLYSQSEM